MRKSPEVQLTLLAALALSLTACRDQRRDCVDAQNHKIPDGYCQAGGGSSGYGAGYSSPHYVYGGASGGHVGDSVVGGSVSRGGFGGLGGGHGFGGGGE